MGALAGAGVRAGWVIALVGAGVMVEALVGAGVIAGWVMAGGVMAG